MKLNKILRTVLLLVGVSVSAGASAVNPYSDCGIGAALFDNKVGAVISNVIWDAGTTAITSAVSSKDTCNAREDKVSAAKFIFDSYALLEEETARGNGEHLNTVLNILDCGTAENKSDILSKIRVEFTNDVAQDSYQSSKKVEKAESFYNHVIETCNTVA